MGIIMPSLWLLRDSDEIAYVIYLAQSLARSRYPHLSLSFPSLSCSLLWGANLSFFICKMAKIYPSCLLERVILSFIHLILFEGLLCARHCARCWGRVTNRVVYFLVGGGTSK